MSEILVAAALLLPPSLLPAVALVGAGPLALCVAPLVTAAVAAAAGSVAIATSTAPVPIVLAVLVLLNLAAAAHLRSARPRPAGSAEWAAAAVVLAAAAVPLVVLRTPIISWDGHSIWLLHARWFFAGGDFARDQLANPAVGFSHADYPPLVPAAVGAVWRVRGAIDMHLGQVVVGLLNISVVGLLGLGVLRVARTRVAVSAVVGALVCLAAYGFAGQETVNAGADLLAAASAAAALLYLVLLPPDRFLVGAGLLCVVVTGGTKNEGLPMALIVLTLFVLRRRRALRPLLPALALTGALLLVWPVVSRAAGAHSDILAGLTGSEGPKRTPAELAERLVTATRTVLTWCRVLLVAAGACTLAGLFTVRRARRALDLGSTAASWVALAGTIGALVAAYAVGPYELSWHLSTSIARTTIAPRLLLLVEVVVWGLTVWDALALAPARLARARAESAEPATAPG